MPADPLVGTTMAATVGEVAFVGEERKEQSRLKGCSARRAGGLLGSAAAAARMWIPMSPFNFSYVSISQLTI